MAMFAKFQEAVQALNHPGPSSSAPASATSGPGALGLVPSPSPRKKWVIVSVVIFLFLAVAGVLYWELRKKKAANKTGLKKGNRKKKNPTDSDSDEHSNLTQLPPTIQRPLNFNLPRLPPLQGALDSRYSDQSPIRGAPLSFNTRNSDPMVGMLATGGIPLAPQQPMAPMPLQPAHQGPQGPQPPQPPQPPNPQPMASPTSQGAQYAPSPDPNFTKL